MSSGAGLYRDALQEIVERIPLHKDILRCAAVCRQCRSIVMDNTHRLPQKLPLCYCLPRQHPLPLLMLCNDEEVSGKVDFLSVLDNKSFTDLAVPEISGNWVAGSCNGWLLLVEILGEEKISLLNPLTRAQLPLPSLSTFEPPLGSFDYDILDFGFVRRILVISEPNARNSDVYDFIVVAIISSLDVVSFCRRGDETWTTIKGSPGHVNDVASYKGQLYAVVAEGALLSFDVENQRAPTLVAGYATGDFVDGRRYLIESTSGELLMVVRIEDISVCSSLFSTLGFSVYKLEQVDESQVGVLKASYLHPGRHGRVMEAIKYKWVQLESLDGQVLFVGRSYSKSVPASLFPDLKGNCIYFTDDDAYLYHTCVARRKAGIEGFEEFEEVKYEMGIYEMGEKSIRSITSIDDKRFRQPPIWVEPNPWQ